MGENIYSPGSFSCLHSFFYRFTFFFETHFTMTLFNSRFGHSCCFFFEFQWVSEVAVNFKVQQRFTIGLQDVFSIGMEK